MARRPFRRTLIFASVALGVALAAAGGWKYARASAPLSGPIIVISIDTLRADHLPSYGYRKIKTPAIDQLAANGVVFEQAYSHAVETLPAHAALLAGRLPFETGVRDDVGGRVRPDERLLPQLLRERGYATGAVVSASRLGKRTGINQGFDFFDDEMPFSRGPRLTQSGQRDGGESEKIAERWLANSGSSRVFLFLHLNEPHKPYAPPDRFAAYSPYDGEIAYADEIVGRLVHYLKSHQLYDRSTIVLLSDHGEGLGDHGEQEHGLFLYDEAIHVPLIIKQESNAQAGRRVRDLVQHMDVVPTILDLVNAPAPGALHGRSLKPLLEGGGGPGERPVYSEAFYAHNHFGWSALTALTTSRYSYIHAPREELYDRTRDRRAHDNLVNLANPANPGGINAETKRARQLLASLVPASETAPDADAAGPSPDPKDKWEVLERYRAAVDLAADRKWLDAIGLFQRVLRDEPAVAQVWNELAEVSSLANRNDLALDAYLHVIELEPMQPEGYLGAAAVRLKERKLEEARANATQAAELLADKDTTLRASAHQLLASIALASRDLDVAREEAGRAREADPGLAMPAFIEGRVLYDQGKYEEAAAQFQQASAVADRPGATAIADLHYYAGDTLVRLDRPSDAEVEFLEELRLFPENVRARAALATLYHADGRVDAAETAVTEMLHAAPTAETYATASRLLKSFGQLKQAEAIRAEANRTFHAPRR